MSSHIGQNPKKGLFTWEPFLKKCDILWTKNEKKKKKKMKIYGFQFFQKHYVKQLMARFWKIALCTTRYQGVLLEAYCKYHQQKVPVTYLTQ